MRKIGLFVLSILLCLFCLGGCGTQSGNTIKNTQMNEESSAVEEKQKRPLDEYVESKERERFGEAVSFEITDDIYQKEPPEPYCNTNEDGSIDLFLDATVGTPYNIEGPIYDHDMFIMKTYVKCIQGDNNAEGSGSVTYLYRFTPIKSGDTEIVTLNRYLVDDVYEGTLYNIIVEDDLKCKMNWYGRVIEKENLVINGLSD